jgi:hypothetical protein
MFGSSKSYDIISPMVRNFSISGEEMSGIITRGAIRNSKISSLVRGNLPPSFLKS